MTRPLSEEVIEKIGEAGTLYYRLALVVGAAGAGKTGALREAAAHLGAPLVNVNLELSRRMLDLVERQRPRRIGRFLDRIVAERGSDVVLLDNIEILFDAALRQHPAPPAARPLAEQGRGRGLERVYRRQPRPLCRTRPSGIPPLPIGRCSGRGHRSGDMIGTGSRQGAMSCGVHPAASHARRGMIGSGPGRGAIR